MMKPGFAILIESEFVSPSGELELLPEGCLHLDVAGAMAQLVAHLDDEGCRSIAYVGLAPRATDAARLAALTAATDAAGVATPTVYATAGISAEHSLGLARRIEIDRPDAVVCYDDKLALHLIDALRQVGLSVPGDVAIVGFDDIPFARISNPRLTTLAQPGEQLGRMGADMLTAALEHGVLPPSIQLPVRLVVRETTRRRTAGGAGVELRRPTGATAAPPTPPSPAPPASPSRRAGRGRPRRAG
jgi:DNA-binding LacI/PurR family transcriptional regulator